MEDIWIGGKYSGHIQEYETFFGLFFSKNLKEKYNIQDIYLHFNENNKNIIFKDCKRIQKYISNKYNLTKNKYKYCKDDNNKKYIEVQLQKNKNTNKNHIMKCDIEDIPIIEERIWYAFKGKDKKTYYVKSRESIKRNQTYTLFHRRICPQYEEIDHINREGLDNRKSNLRESNIRINKPKIIINNKQNNDEQNNESNDNEQNNKQKNDEQNKQIIKKINPYNKSIQKNNKSGIPGIYKTKGKLDNSYRWKAQWLTEGKRCSKSFSEIEYGGRNIAKKLAFECRQKNNKNTIENLGFEFEEKLFIEEDEDIFKDNNGNWIATYIKDNIKYEIKPKVEEIIIIETKRKKNNLTDEEKLKSL